MLLGVEQVEVGAYTDLQTEFGGIELGLRGAECLLQRPNAGDAAAGIEISLASLQAGVAGSDFKVLACPFLIGHRFAHARVDQPALIHRQVELHADSGDAGIDLGGAEVLPVVDGVAGDGIHRGIAARTITFDFLVGNGFGQALDFSLQVALGRTGGPFINGAFDIQRLEIDRRVDRAGRFADEFFERAQPDVERVLLGDLLRNRKIVTRLRLVGVGDGGGADFKVPLGRCQLLGDGVLLRIDESDVVFCLQHIKISLRDPQNQVLLGQLKLEARYLHLNLGLLIHHLVLFAKQRLGRADRQAIGVVVGVAAR